MALRKKFEIIFLVFFFIFSSWLMWKSFSYDSKTSEFAIARNEVGDFGLHLALIRSFSLGNNFPPESPFYPGPPLPYHYAFDLTVGLLERIGVRIDYAVNGISVVFFMLLLYLIFKLPQLILGTGPTAGVLAVVLFLFSSSLSFIDFFKGKAFNFSLIQQVWRLPDYVNKGPFDGSVISIFSSLNPYLNQRHLIVAMALSVFMILYVARKLLRNADLSTSSVVILGMLLGLGTRVHVLLAFGTGVVLSCLFIFFRKARHVVSLAAFFLLFALPHIKELLTLHRGGGIFFNPGFLASHPLTLWSFLQFWWLNIGLALLFIPLGVICSDAKQQKVFFAILPLFVIANLFQLSFRIEHNYALIELFFVLCMPFLVRGLVAVWKRKLVWKGIAVVSFIGLTLSGFLNLMAVKNDFHYRVADAPSNPFMRWIKENTEPNAIFLSAQNLYDPVTLAGRKSYFGATYYLEVMGYDIRTRREQTKDFYEVQDTETLKQMRSNSIQFIVVPKKPVADFLYFPSVAFLNQYLKVAYRDIGVTVYSL